MQSITLGDVTVTRITEWEGCAPITAQLAPEGGREVWERHSKERPYFPLSSHLDTPYIQDLGRAGVKPDDVDIVVCTHLHFDHVGWNTVLKNREWVPTFANATYLVSNEDFDYWNPLNRTLVAAPGHTPESCASSPEQSPPRRYVKIVCGRDNNAPSTKMSSFSL
jgi:hypothetical protein